MSRRSPMHLLLVGATLAILAAHCGAPEVGRMPDDQASRCLSGLDLFARGRCTTPPTAELYGTVKQEFVQV